MSSSIVLISCDVRNPSKKCRNGTRDRSVAAWATSAKSCASCTELDASIANPVDRAAITSLWSPKIDKRVRRDGAGGDVDHGGRELAGDLEHVRQHQQQALRGGERGRHRTGLERAVERARGARLRLHLDHFGHRSPQVRASFGGPRVGVLAHRRRGRDRVDRDHFRQGVGDRAAASLPSRHVL